jgi:hypothetical protein
MGRWFSKRHKNLTGDDLHSVIWSEVADTASRLALTVTQPDEGKVVYQLDNDSLWVLVDYTGPTYVEITAAGVAAVTSVFGRTGDVSAQSGDYTKGDVGLGNVENILSNLTAVVDPTTSDNTGNGYSTGSLWVNTSSDVAFICVDASAGTWQEIGAGGGGGTGDVTGPASATDNAVARFNTTSGKEIQNSAVTVSDSGDINAVNVVASSQVSGPTVQASSVLDSGDAVTIFEKAVPATPTAANRGMLWVRNDNPNKIVFRDGDGTDHDLQDAASSIVVEDEGSPVFTASSMNFVGSGVTVDEPVAGEARVTIAAGAAPVDSVFGRTGTVAATGGDYTASQITNTPAGDILATDVQAAIDELDSEKAPNTHTQAYTTVDGVPTDSFLGRDTAGTGATEALHATQARSLLNVADGATADGATGDAYAVSHEADATAHDAAEIVNTPAGNIAATDVQAALNELDTEKLSSADVGSAAFENVGTTIGDAVQLENVGGSAGLPAVDGSQLTNLPSGGGGNDISVEDEGVELTAAVTKFNFVGAGITVTEPVANEVQVAVAPGAAPVDSVHGRTGVVVSASGDYGSDQVDNDSTVSGGTGSVSTALEQLASDITAKTVDVVSNVASGVILGRDTAGSGDSEELGPTEVRTLINVEDGADVTDTANVTAAGAVMDSELTSESGIKTLTVPDNTTISGFGADLVDDVDAATARATLDVTLGNLPSFSIYGELNPNLTDGYLAARIFGSGDPVTGNPVVPGIENRYYVDTSTDPWEEWRDNGTAWVKGGGVRTSGTPASLEYARFTAEDTIEGRTGSEVKTDLALDNVDNTADADKPVSTATASALDLKAATTGTTSVAGELAPYSDTGGKTLGRSNVLVGTSTAATAGRTINADGGILAVSLTGTGAPVATADALGAATFGAVDEVSGSIGQVANTGAGAVAFGSVDANLTTTAEITNTGTGSLVGGKVVSSTSDAVINNTGIASLVLGDAGVGCTIEGINASDGSIVHGKAIAGGVIQSDDSPGSLAGGVATGAGSTVRVQHTGGTDAGGSLAHGYVASGGVVEATSRGSVAFGLSDGGNIKSRISAFAFGESSNTGTGTSQIYADFEGCYAGGYALGSGTGSALITSGAYGAFAHGYASNTTIEATGVNSAQFFPGANDQNLSLQVGDTTGAGTGIHLLAGGDPGTGYQDGMFWSDGTDVYVRTGGASVDLGASGGGGASDWVGLTDTPGTITAGRFVVGNVGGTALDFWATDPLKLVKSLDVTPASSTGELVAFADTSGTGTGRSNVRVGQLQAGNGTVTIGGDACFAGGSFSSGGNGTITASQPGSVALGTANQISGTGELVAGGTGSVALGQVVSANGTASIRADGFGSLAGGQAQQFTSAETTTIDANGIGSIAWGEAANAAGTTITTAAAAGGALAMGYCSGGTIQATFDGAGVHGYAATSGTVQATDEGAHAFGYASGASATLEATGEGAMAIGRASAAAITASGNGSLAVGASLVSAIVASATNSFQFAEGTNALADSLAVGSHSGNGVRICANGDPGASVQNGDIWCDGTHVYARGNGVDVQLT